MRLLLILLLAALAPNALAEIYKHVDKHGNVVYTDQPPENAEQVTLPKANVLNMDPAARSAASRYKSEGDAARQAGTVPADEGYTHLYVGGVSDGDTLQNPEGPVTLSVKSDPPLRAGHKLLIRHNDEVANIDGSESLTIEHIARGTHTFVAEIRDADGRVVITSAPITLNVQRASVIRRP